MDKIVDKITPERMGYSGPARAISSRAMGLGLWLGKPREAKSNFRKDQWALLHKDESLRSLHMTLQEVRDVLDSIEAVQVPSRF